MRSPRRATRGRRFERLATALARLRWRQADARFRLLRSEAIGYRVARAVLVTVAVACVSCALLIFVVLLSTL